MLELYKKFKDDLIRKFESEVYFEKDNYNERWSDADIVKVDYFPNKFIIELDDQASIMVTLKSCPDRLKPFQKILNDLEKLPTSCHKILSTESDFAGEYVESSLRSLSDDFNARVVEKVKRFNSKNYFLNIYDVVIGCNELIVHVVKKSLTSPNIFFDQKIKGYGDTSTFHELSAIVVEYRNYDVEQKRAIMSNFKVEL